MDNENNSQLAATLVRRVGEGATAGQVADAIVATWHEINVALTPIIGQRGIATLFKRSLYLASAKHTWLAGTHEGIPVVLDLEALQAVFAEQTDAHAAAGAITLLHTFDELLASLVGPSLTERLLRSVWANSLSGTPAQDPSP